MRYMARDKSKENQSIRNLSGKRGGGGLELLIDSQPEGRNKK
jgi:hypothetical protein